MIRRNVLTVIELGLVTAALSAIVYIVAEAAHRPGVPSAAQAGAAGSIVLLALAAVATLGAICIVLWIQVPRMVRRQWVRALERRCARQIRQIQRRQAQHRHAARIGGAR